jgi:DNA-binding NarL/FixJ family response regulator
MRIVIAEDSAVLRAGLVEVLIDRGHEVMAAVGDAETLLAAVVEHRPDVTVIDIRMPPTYTDEGLRAAVRLRSEMPETGILVFSQYIETRYTHQLLAGRAGGIGYLLKERVADVDEFTDALERVAAGGTALDPEVVRHWLGASRRTDSLAALSPREHAVLALMAEGRTNSAVARKLSISDGAVEKHVSNIFARLGLEKSCADNRRVLAVLRYLEGDA